MSVPFPLFSACYYTEENWLSTRSDPNTSCHIIVVNQCVSLIYSCNFFFPQNVQTEVSSLASLQFTNLPEAAALLYKYEANGDRHTTTESFVGSVQVFIEAPGVIYTRAR